MTQLLRARRLLTEQGWLDDHQLRIEEGTITTIEPIPSGVMGRDADLLCPAYIDTHVHGGVASMLWMKRQTHSTSWRCTKHVKG